jgi:tetratricopeptide (TPR) repeat protein
MKRGAAVCALSLAALAGLCAAAPKPKAKPAKPASIATPKKTEEQRTAQQLHDAALDSFAAGNLEAAKAGFEKVLVVSPGNAPALINLALIAQRQQRYAEAEKSLRQILKLDTENAAAWLLMGIGAYEQDRLDAALAHLAQAVLYAPKDARARRYLGVTLGRRGWYSAGEEELRRAVELDPRSADAHYNLAAVYMERVPPAVELARRHYTRALELGAAQDAALAAKIGK